MGAVVRTLATGGVLVALLIGVGPASVRAALPALQAMFEKLVPEFSVVRFGPERESADRVLRIEVTRQRYVLLGGVAIEPNARGTANASTLALQTLFGPTLALWVALAWPAGVGRLRWVTEPALRLALALPPCLMLGLLDTPVVLAAELWKIMIDYFAPAEFSPLVAAGRALQRGGRYALGLAIGAAAVATAQRLLRAAPAGARPSR